MNIIFTIILLIFGSIIAGALLSLSLMFLYDTIITYFLKKRIPKDKDKLKDGGNTSDTSIKEAKEDDNRLNTKFREFEKLRDLATREQPAKGSITNFNNNGESKTGELLQNELLERIKRDAESNTGISKGSISSNQRTIGSDQESSKRFTPRTI